MAKSRTKRKASSKDIEEIHRVTDAFTDYVRQWTKKEARKLAFSEIVIIPATWGFQVGKFSVKSNEHVWQVYNSFNELQHSFGDRRSAITWCIFDQINKFKLRDRLWAEDTKLSNLVQDQKHYTYSKQKALKKKDLFSVDVFNARLAEVESQLEPAKQDLEKTLKSAKYLKGIWEKPL